MSHWSPGKLILEKASKEEDEEGKKDKDGGWRLSWLAERRSNPSVPSTNCIVLYCILLCLHFYRLFELYKLNDLMCLAFNKLVIPALVDCDLGSCQTKGFKVSNIFNLRVAGASGVASNQFHTWIY